MKTPLIALTLFLGVILAVHLAMNGVRIIDDTFGTVIHQGKPLDRKALLAAMVANTII